MPTVSQGKLRQFITRTIWLAGAIAILALINFLSSPQFGAVLEALKPPALPPLNAVVRENLQAARGGTGDPDSSRDWLDQNWDMAMTRKFNHISQGTHTLPVPLEWLLALERPAASVFSMPFGKRGKFADNDYLLRFGFIQGEKNELNPHGLPVGLAATPNQNIPGISNEVTAVGFNCAACHTSHFTYGGTEYIVAGGPATTDLGQLTAALGAALGQTLVSSKIPFFKGRFKRFARAVLGDDAYKDINVADLEKELQSTIDYLATLPAEVAVVEGFGRLDALNRIGNQVFALDTGRFDNYVAINAPVAFPHIWTASWFNWVQYDGSIMAPLIRNTGEAMGVSALVDTVSPVSERRFSSSIDINALWWIETALSGKPPYPGRRWSGLLSPRWPASLGRIDEERVARGREIYREICSHCHLPPIDSEEIWSPSYFGQISWNMPGEEQPRLTPDHVLKLNLISLDQIGTDPAQAQVLSTRTVNTAGDASGPETENTPGLGINTQVCTRTPAFPPDPYSAPGQAELAPTPLTMVNISDGPAINFGLALGGIVQQVNDAWFAQNYISLEQQEDYEERRPNCLQANAGYKARPLNGIWATAPFLHNGSVPTLKDLLSDPEKRPTRVQLGSIEFDAENVGIMQVPNLHPGRDKKYTRDGLFILDTSVPGNSNRGHEFSDEYNPNLPWWQQKKGVIGKAFSEEDVLAIIEFLKTL